MEPYLFEEVTNVLLIRGRWIISHPESSADTELNFDCVPVEWSGHLGLSEKSVFFGIELDSGRL
jgi:hypothetical protein